MHQIKNDAQLAERKLLLCSRLSYGGQGKQVFSARLQTVTQGNISVVFSDRKFKYWNGGEI